MNATSSIDFETIFLLAPVGLCISQQRMIVRGNEALAAMFGYPVAALNGQSLEILYPSSDEFERTGARIEPIINATGQYSDERIMKRANGELFWCHVVGRALVPNQAHAAGIWTFEDVSAKRPVSAHLTPREREIAALLVAGQTSKVIARHTNLSPRTVEMHRARLMRKFNAATSSELVHKLLGMNNSSQ